MIKNLWVLLIILVLLPGVHALPQDSSLLLWWALDEGSGNTVGDISGYDNNGTVIGSPQWMSGASCVSGSCIKFNGTPTQVYAQYTPTLNITGQFTFMVSVNLTNNTVFQEIFDAQSANANGFALAIAANGTVRAETRGPNGFAWSTGALEMNKWYNLTMGWNGTDITLEINNILNATGSRTANLTENIQLRQLATADNTSYFNGSMDCVSLYNRTLTTAEKATDHCPPISDTTAPVWTTHNSPASSNNTNFTNFLTMDAGVYDANLATANVTIFNSTMFPWLYRETITITNNNASAVLPLNYTVNLTFNHAALVTAGKSLASGDDIRILYNFSVELDRLNLTAFNTATTTIAFRTREAIPAGGTATNYEFYYGYPYAGPPPANPNNVYLFFDNFSYSSCDATFNSTWAIGQKAGSPLPVNNCSIDAGTLRLDENGSNSDLGYYTNPSFPPDVLVSVKMRINANGTIGSGILYRYNSSEPTTAGEAWPYADYEYNGVGSGPVDSSTSRYFGSDTFPLDSGPQGDIEIGTWYTEEARIYNTTWHHYVNGVLFLNNLTLTGNDKQGNPFSRSGHVGLALFSSPDRNDSVSYDDVLVREYMDPEPSATSALTIPPARVVAYCSNTSWAGTAWNSSAECGTLNTTSWREAVYYFNLTAWDDSGLNVTEYYRMNLTRNKFNFSVRVWRGWNLIGLWENQTLLNITNWTAAPTNITVAQCFNPVNQSWAKYNWTNSSGNSSYVCAKGLAVFILIGRNDTLNFTEITLNEWAPNAGGNWTVNRTIIAGYNYLGAPGNVSLRNVSTWVADFRWVSWWNATKQAYVSYLNLSIGVGGLGNTTIAPEGTGVVIYATQNETITQEREHDSMAQPVAAAILVISSGAWLYRWYSRRGQA